MKRKGTAAGVPREAPVNSGPSFNDKVRSCSEPAPFCWLLGTEAFFEMPLAMAPDTFLTLKLVVSACYGTVGFFRVVLRVKAQRRTVAKEPGGATRFCRSLSDPHVNQPMLTSFSNRIGLPVMTIRAIPVVATEKSSAAMVCQSPLLSLKTEVCQG